MAVPVSMSDLSLNAASNSPQGTDPIGNNLDDLLRSHAAILRSTYATSSANIASAATTDIASSDGEYVLVTGTTNISSLGNGYPGCYRQVAFAGSLTLTYSANLILPGASNLVTQANDVFAFRCLGTNIWVLVGGSRVSDATKAPLASPALTGSPTVNGLAVGYRDVPLAAQNAAYTLLATDAGKSIAKTDASAYTYTVPAVFTAGQVVTVANAGSAGNVTLAGSGVTLQLCGTTTTGNRTVAPGGLCTLFFVSATLALVGGAGVS